MINYSFYPILRGASRTVKDFDEQSILYAEKNIEKYIPTKMLDIDIPVWLISTVILHNLGNKFLTRKFVTNYSKLFESKFIKDMDDKNTRQEVLFEYFGLENDIRYIPLRTENFVKIKLGDYLELETVVTEPRLKLVNQILEKGFVIIEKARFSYLLRLVLEGKLMKKIKNMKDYHDNQLINTVVNKLYDIYPKDRKRVQHSSTEIPKSIQELIDKAYHEHHLNHNERIKLGIYLQAEEYDEDFILDIFKALSDYNEKTTRYQLQSLKRYIK